jgi:hypothetical protein
MAQEMYTRGMAQAVKVRNLADSTQGLLYPYLIFMYAEISVYFYFMI